jgi:hypothetical protein
VVDPPSLRRSIHMLHCNRIIGEAANSRYRSMA